MGSGPLAAFTLVELLVVITIIGILVAMMVPAVHAAMLWAKVVQAESDLRQISIALHQYYVRHQVMPPARKYCLSAKRDQYLVLPRELIDDACMGAFPPDAFNDSHTYRYTAVGPGFINDSPTTIKFVLPEDFPRPGGEWIKYTEFRQCPVKCVVWSFGPAGPPPFETLLTFNPLDPSVWYPTHPRGIICRYFTGQDWYSVP